MGGDRKVPRGIFSHEIEKIRGSRFITSVIPFRDEADREAAVERLRKDHPSANHHCWAWRRGDDFRYSDDGEPSGSAGRPILQQIDGHDFDRSCVIVTRIFGGTKLGVGGLMRAYGQAARETLLLAPSEPLVDRRGVVITFAYDREGVVQSVMQAHGLSPADSDYTEQVKMRFEVRVEKVDAFVADLRERCAGQIDVELREEGGE